MISPRRTRCYWSLAFFAAGVVSISAQVLLLRELLVSLQGDETAIGIGLAIWLCGIALGALAARSPARAASATWALLAFAALGLAGPCGLLVARLVPLAIAVPAGEMPGFGNAVVLSALTMAIPGLLVGVVFTALAGAGGRSGLPPGPGIARLYVLESAGSLLAGSIVTFVVLPYLSAWQGLAGIAALCVLATYPAARGGLRIERLMIGLCALTLAICAVPQLADRIERVTQTARFRALAYGIPFAEWKDTPYQQIALGGNGVRHLYLSARYAGSFPDDEAVEARVHAIACLAPRLDRVLILGGLLPLGLRHLFEHGAREIDLAELDVAGFRWISRFLPPPDLAALSDPRLRCRFTDPRRILDEPGAPYDLILVEQGDPLTLFSGRLSTVEFFRQAAAHLAPDGVFVSRLSVGSNAVVGQRAALAGSVYRAVGEAFPVVRASPDPEGLIVAGKDPRAVTLDPAELATRFRARGISSKAIVAGDFEALFPTERVAAVTARLSSLASSAPASRDERPASLIRSLAVRHRVIRSPLAPLLERVSRGEGAGVASLALIPSLVVLGLVLWRRVRGFDARRLAAVHAAAAVGGAAMLWNLSILFAYQTVAGALYGSLGLLTSLFMLGLAVGGALLRKAGDADRRATPGPLGSVVAAALLFAMLMPLALRAALSSHGNTRSLAPWVLGGLLLLAGVVTGAVFPATAGALLASGCPAIHAGGLTEAADHIGAASFALIGAVLIIPTLGLWHASWIMAAIIGIAGVIVMLANRAPRRVAPLTA